MKPLKKLLDIDRLTYEQRMDIALVLAIIPHLFLQKLPMLIFVFIAFIFIITGRNTPRHQHIATLLGLIAFIVSFFDNYNFSDFSRMLFFVSVVNGLLLYAIMLQRLKGEYNKYLKISPALLMMLVFFYYTSITMLVYSIFVLFVFVLLAIWEKMDAKLSTLIRTTTMLFMLSLPAVIVLFIVFPRISFKKAEFGFKGELEMRTGHDGKMHLDSNALLIPSERVVMEVMFPDGKIPADNELYFRGSALYVDKGTLWQPLNLIGTKTPKVSYRRQSLINYKILLHPHNQHWLYTLDIPLLIPNSAKLNYNLMLINEKKIEEVYRYEVTSALDYQFNVQMGYPKEALWVNRTKNPKMATLMKALKKEPISDEAKATKIIELFASQDIAYTLRPKPLDLNRSIDSFIFEQKEGYCVHFASAFAKSARMAGIPSRVVTGFKASRKNMVENYLIVKEKDAHAWVELYLQGKGWVRYEPTITAARILDTVDNIEGSMSQNSIFKEINMQFMYLKYLINNWILDYNRSKQRELWQEILKNTVFLIKILASIALITLISLAIFLMLQRQKCEDRALCAMKPLLKRLKRLGYEKEPYETMQSFLERVEQSRQWESLNEISKLYHRIKYSNHQEPIKLLEDKIQLTLASIKKEKR
ncbi:MAG: DUF3488 domain-containing protein [Campylobacterales bacterium]|nr:DUF3488 domain-containing protein [Campylobacterales bacterium]